MLAAAMSVLAACTSKEEMPVSGKLQDGHIFASAQALSKASVSHDDGALAWQKNDAIAVYNGSSFSKYTVLDAFAGSAEAEFELSEGASTLGSVAVSPYALAPAYDGSSISFTLPASYAWKKDCTNAPMIATGATDGHYSFVHVAGMLAITYNNVPYTATRFRLTADKNISGACTVAEGSVTSAAGGKTVDYTFELEETTKMTFYVPLPVQSYEYFKIALYDEDDNLIYGSDKTAALNQSVPKANLLILPAMTLQSKHLKGQWKFENEANPLKASVGNDLQLSAGSVTRRTDGPTCHNNGIRTTTGGYLYADHGITGNTWTISTYFRQVNTQDNPLIHINTGASVDAQLAINNVSQFAITQKGWTSGQVVTPGYMGFHHVDIVNNNGTVTLYLDYMQVYSFDDSSTNYFTMTEGKTTFFADNTANAGDYDVFDLAIWDTALSRDELLAYAGLKAVDKSDWTATSNDAGGSWSRDDWADVLLNDTGTHVQYNGATQNFQVTIDMKNSKNIGYVSYWVGTPWGNSGQKYVYLHLADSPVAQNANNIGYLYQASANRNNGLVFSKDYSENNYSGRYLMLIISPNDRYNSTYMMMAKVLVYEKLY